MVQVPIAPENRVERAPLAVGPLRYDAPRDFVGPAVEQFGQALGQAAEGFDQIEAVYDNADKLERQNDLSAAISESRSKFRNLRGKDAALQMPEVYDGLKKRAEDLLGAARSPRARSMTSRAFDVSLLNMREFMQGHADEQMFAYEGTQLESQLGQFESDAVDTRGTPEGILNTENAKATMQKLAAHNGWDPDTLKAKTEGLIESIHSRRIMAMDAEDGEPTKALAYLDQVKDEISDSMEGKLRNMLNPRVDAAWARGEIEGIVSGLSTAAAADNAAPGLITPGNINLHDRPVVHNADGSISTVRSISIEEDGQTILIPTVVGGKVVSDDKAVEAYHRTGKHLGIFESETAATSYAQSLHRDQEREYAGGGNADPLHGVGRTVDGGRYGAPRSYGGHTGTDFAAPAGTPIYATASGRVKRSYFDPAYGNRIEVDHGNGIVTTYSHLQARNVQEGDPVTAETVLGGVGNTGSASHGNHVHYEKLENGRKVDPSQAPAGEAGVAADPRLNSQNVQAAIDAYVKANPGISERRADALRAAGDRYVADARQDRAQAEQDADRRIMDWINTHKPGADDITSMADIPASVMQGASPGTIASIQSRVQATQSRIQARSDAEAAKQADRLEKAAVFELYTLSDAELARTDMRKYAGRIGLDKLGPWIDRQQAAANTATAAAVSTDRIASKIDSIGKDYGASRGPQSTDAQRQAWVALRGYVERKVAGRANKDVSDEDLRGMIIAGMTDVEVPGSGWFWNDTKPRSQSGPVNRANLPNGVAQTVRAQLRARGVANPSEDLIWSTYTEGKARGIFQ